MESFKQTLKKINDEQQKYDLFLKYKRNEVNSMLMNEFLKSDDKDFEIEFVRNFFVNQESYRYGDFCDKQLEKYLEGKKVNFKFKFTNIVDSKPSLVYIIKNFKDSLIYSLFVEAIEIERLYGDLLRSEIIEQCKENKGLNTLRLNLEKLRLIFEVEDFTVFEFEDWLKLQNIKTYILKDEDNKGHITISIIF